MKKIGIIGASGYSGGELLRYLAAHPHAKVVWASANEHAGKAVTKTHPNLLGAYDLTFVSTPKSSADFEALRDLDICFLCLPHGLSMGLMPELAKIKSLKVIDLSGDFRLREFKQFAEYYGLEHTAKDLQKSFVYGLPELFGGQIKEATKVANPGCFATAITLGLAPLAVGQLLQGDIVVDAKTGSSGAGIKPLPTTHHPDRAEGFSAYKFFKHQHQPEIVQSLADISSSTSEAWQSRLVVQTHSAPMVRGIFASIYVRLNKSMSQKALSDTYAAFYNKASFVRLVEGSPNVKWVAHTNYADIGVIAEDADSTQRAIIFVAIDNMVKGASGQAIQNMNLMMGWEETSGLKFLGGHP